jgi:hypothetical protein
MVNPQRPTGALPLRSTSASLASSATPQDSRNSHRPFASMIARTGRAQVSRYFSVPRPKLTCNPTLARWTTSSYPAFRITAGKTVSPASRGVKGRGARSRNCWVHRSARQNCGRSGLLQRLRHPLLSSNVRHRGSRHRVQHSLASDALHEPRDGLCLGPPRVVDVVRSGNATGARVGPARSGTRKSRAPIRTLVGSAAPRAPRPAPATAGALSLSCPYLMPKRRSQKPPAASRVDSTMQVPAVPVVIVDAPSQKPGTYWLVMNWWRARALRVRFRWAGGTLRRHRRG